MKISVSRPALALSGAVAVAGWLLAAPALAGQGAPAPHADQGKHLGQANQSTATTTATAQPAKDKAAKKKAAATKPAPTATSAAKKPTSTQSAPAAATRKDGVGNNGTVKIDRLGAMDRIPNNVPHPGCTFQVEWFGFDGGPEVLSTVTFTMQAPTRDVGLTVAGPSAVPVGGDPASGAGTSTGPDAVQAYTLSFSGEPQAQQGYHVRLTVATPRSQGNDTKTKVFWVEPCSASVARSAAGAGTSAGTAAGASVPSVLGMSTTSASLAGPRSTPSADLAVASADRPAAESSSDVPLVVEAGEAWSALTDGHSPWWTALGVAGLLVAGVALALRLRGRA